MANKSESEPQSTYEKVPWLSISLFRVSVNKITRDKRKEKKYMKLKRRLMMLALSATMLLSAVMVAQAANSNGAGSETIYSDKYNLSLYGYVDFMKGNWLCRNEYFYTAILSGEDVTLECVESKKFNDVYLKVYDDEGGYVASAYPYAGERVIRKSEKEGYSSFFAKFYMRCYSDEYTAYGF